MKRRACARWTAARPSSSAAGASTSRPAAPLIHSRRPGRRLRPPARPRRLRQRRARARPRASCDATGEGTCGRPARLDPLGAGRAARAQAHGLPLSDRAGADDPRQRPRRLRRRGVARRGRCRSSRSSLMRGDEARALLDETARAPRRSTVGRRHPRVRARRAARRAARASSASQAAASRSSPAAAPRRRRPLEERGIAHLPPRSVAGAARPVPPGRRAPLRLRGARVRRPRRAALELRPLGGGDRAAARRARRRGASSVLFAGGVHDARSAAMVAAAAAPLAARGARIGVLMGTAYLFTDEAVASGAIQRRLPGGGARLRAHRAPRHGARPLHPLRRDATTCARSRERARLRGRGHARRRDVGGARAAQPRSPAHRRQGPASATATRSSRSTARRQRREGMFMIGQVAALRGERTTIAELHARGRAGSIAVLRAAARRRRASARRAARRRHRRHGRASSPARPTCRAFWANIVDGKNGITEVPTERWNAATLLRPGRHGRRRRRPSGAGSCPTSPSTRWRTASRRARSRRSSRCSSSRSRSPAARSTTPATLERPFDRDRASVIFGAEAGTDLARRVRLPRAATRSSWAPLPAELDATLPAPDRGLVPRRARQRHRRAHRQPARPRRRQLHRRRGVRVVARRRRPRGARSSSPARSDLVLCGGADLHNGDQRLPACSRASTRCRRPGSASRSTPRPTASPSARASRAWC